MTYWQQLMFVGSITLPVFTLVFIGMWLRLRNKIGDEFVAQASYVVFNLALPVLMFSAIIRTNIMQIGSIKLVAFSLIMTLFSFMVLWVLGNRFIDDRKNLGVFVQSCFRSNLAILGLAFCALTFGEPGLAVGAVLLAVITPLYNVLSVYALTHAAAAAKLNYWLVFKNIICNPLIIAIMLALPLSYWQLQLPAGVMRVADYLAAMTLPLALICVGGSLSGRGLRTTRQLSWLAVLVKLVVMPLLTAGIAYYLGFSGIELGCLVIMFGCPTAAASFIMVRSIGGNHVLAANIIALTTLFSLFTISVIIYCLKLFAVI